MGKGGVNNKFKVLARRDRVVIYCDEDNSEEEVGGSVGKSLVLASVQWAFENMSLEFKEKV